MLTDPTVNERKVDEIIKLCKDRMNVSYYKYGAARDNFASGRVDARGCADLCLEKFRKTHNTEYLLDVINYAIFGFLFPLPNEAFTPTDSDQSAGVVGTPITYEQMKMEGF